MTISRRQVLQAGAMGAMLAGVSHRAQAQTLDLARIVVGFPAGSTVDVLARVIAKHMTGHYARTVVIDNKAGAGGQIGTTAVKSAPKDGSTLLLTPMSPFGVFPHTYKSLPYDPVADFTPVGNAVTFNFAVAVGSMVPATVTNLRQLLDWYRATPDKRNIGNPAVGSTLHFTGMLLAKAAGLDIQQVNYVGPAMFTDLSAGNLPACVSTLGSLLPLHQSGRLRIIATTGDARSPFLPDVATFVESGFNDLVFKEWIGAFLPSGTPTEVVMRANQALRAALASQEAAQVMQAQAQEATPSSPEELAALLRQSSEIWRQRVRTVGFTATS